MNSRDMRPWLWGLVAPVPVLIAAVMLSGMVAGATGSATGAGIGFLTVPTLTAIQAGRQRRVFAACFVAGFLVAVGAAIWLLLWGISQMTWNF